MSKNIVRARVTIRGTRPLLQHAFGPESLPLEKQERGGVAGNEPDEWRRTCLVTKQGQLYLRGTYVFACIRDGARYSKRGRGSIQPVVAATLQVEESVILLDRFLPKECLPIETGAVPSRDPTEPVYLDVCGVRNPSTKQRNVRYRIACAPGWGCSFTLLWDRTLVDRKMMQKIVDDASILIGIADGRSVGNGRFQVLSFVELADAETTTTEGDLERPAPDRLGKGRKKMRPVQEPVEANGMSR